MSNLPRDSYGNRGTDETLLVECGRRVVCCYDEEFAIENRFIKATGIAWRGGRQGEWAAARRAAFRNRASYEGPQRDCPAHGEERHG